MTFIHWSILTEAISLVTLLLSIKYEVPLFKYLAIIFATLSICALSALLHINSDLRLRAHVPEGTTITYTYKDLSLGQYYHFTLSNRVEEVVVIEKVDVNA